MSDYKPKDWKESKRTVSWDDYHAQTIELNEARQVIADYVRKIEGYRTFCELVIRKNKQLGTSSETVLSFLAAWAESLLGQK
jgi:hypothetical protein